LRSKDKFYDYLYLILIFFVFSAYVIFVGGDVLRPNRFFVPIMPVFFILVQEGLSSLLSMFDKKKTFAAGALIGAAFAIGFSYYTYKNEFEQIKKYSELEKGLVEKMKITGTWLKNKQQTGRPLVVAATTIGAVSYYSEVVLIDMLGLTDKEIAHNPKPIPEISSREVGWRERNYNVDYVLSRKPDLIYFSTGIKPSAYAERGLFTSEEFMKYYYPYYFTIKEQNFTDIMYKRKSDEDVKSIPVLQPNPNYKKSFVNIYNQAMNTMRDKTKIQEALNLYKQAISEGPSGWGTPYQMIGDVYMQMKDSRKALESYSLAVETDDYNVLAHYYLYQASMEKKDSVSAKLHFDKIVKYAPDMVQ
ncbi:MAG: tetratricopeptide repeat protein, partial [Ignavibacteria bacterium]